MREKRKRGRSRGGKREMEKEGVLMWSHVRAFIVGFSCLVS